MSKPNLHLKISEELDNKLKERAAAEYRSKNSLVKQLISEGLKNE